MDCIPPNPRRVGYIVPIHGPLDGLLYMGSIYSNSYHEGDKHDDSFSVMLFFSLSYFFFHRVGLY